MACGCEVDVRRRGGVGPPRVTVEMKPECWRASMRERMRREEGTEVRPKRALDAF